MGINFETYAIKFKTIIIIIFCITSFMMKYFDRNIISYCIGILLTIKLVYDFSKTQNLSKYINKLIVLLGQYSLLSYLMQIFFLQSIFQFFVKQRFYIGYETFLIILLTSLFLTIICYLIDYLRRKYDSVNKSYKFIFQ